MRGKRGNRKVEPSLTVAAQQTAFLAHYAKIGIVTAAAKAAGVDRQRHYEWLVDPAFPDYKARFADASEEAADALETAMLARGVDGYDRPIYQAGKLVGHERVYSDRLLEIALRARRPKAFTTKHLEVEHTGTVEARVTITLPDNGRTPPEIIDITPSRDTIPAQGDTRHALTAGAITPHPLTSGPVSSHQHAHTDSQETSTADITITGPRSRPRSRSLPDDARVRQNLDASKV